MRSRIGADSFAAALAPMAARVPPVSLPTPSISQRRMVSGLPPGLAVPAAGLLAALQEAEERIGHLDPQTARAMLKELVAAGRRSVAPGVRIEGLPEPSLRASSVRGRRALPPAFVEPPARGPEDPRASDAALLLGTALDAYLPALRAEARSAEGNASDSPCDVVDQPPILCVASQSPSLHTKNVGLLIDLGGDDTYENSAGGASSVLASLESGGEFPIVSVNIDLGGNDVYRTPKAFTETGIGTSFTVAQGSGLGGVGILLDTSGNDRYEARATAPTKTTPISFLYAQGTGAGSQAGLFGASAKAALFDLGGDDIYAALGADTASDLGGTASRLAVIAQGAGMGFSEGEGILIDRGLGNDRYTIDAGNVAGPFSGPVQPWTQPYRFAMGQGASSQGVGVLFDDGGTDDIHAVARAEQVVPQYPLGTDTPLAEGQVFYVPVTNVIAQGSSGVGQAALLEGEGDTTYTIEAIGRGIVSNHATIGQGHAGLGAVGILDDVGGDDAYRITATLTYDDVDLVVDDSCTTLDPATRKQVTCRYADQTLVALNTQAYSQLVYGQGFGYAATGLLEDHAGDDRYLIGAIQRVEVSLDDRLSQATEPPRLTAYGYGISHVLGQGVGQYYGGFGALIEHGGDDQYDAVGDNSVAASAASQTASGSPVVRGITTPINLWVQGSGMTDAMGAFVDAGGTGDRVETTTDDHVTTSPDTGRSIQFAGNWPLTQAGGNMAFYNEAAFMVLGEDPEVFSHPSRPVCGLSTGHRGFGEWSDCPVAGSGPGHEPVQFKTPLPTRGLVPAASGQATSLMLLEDPPSSGELASVVPAEARLTGPSGAPVVGAVIQFDLMLQVPDEIDPYWSGIWYPAIKTQGITDEDGVARGGLRLAVDPALASSRIWRIQATYDGGSGLYPAHSARPIELNDEP